MSTPLNERNPAGKAGLRDHTHNSSGSNVGMYGTPLQRIEQAHERTTGRQERHGRITCAVCATDAYKVALKEAPNGSILLHAFCGHSAAEVLGAMGLSLGDLYPERIRDLSPDGRRAAKQAFKQTAWSAALGVLAREATVVEIAAHDLAGDKALSEADHTRLLLACERIHGARAVLQ